jgi:hypothetical protein
MTNLMDFPRLVFVLSLVVLWFAALVGASVTQWLRPLREEEREVFGVIQAAILTLLGLLIGFTFTMAVSRYDQRKNYEEAEANAIGTEYLRLGFCLPPMRRKCAISCATISISEFCFIPPAISINWMGSTPLRLNCKRSYGPPSKLALTHRRHQ